MENENPVVVIDQENDRKKRSGLAIVLAVAFVAMLGIGTTFAYLTWTTNQTPNRMTTDPTVTADTLEPAWTNAIDNTDTYKASDGEAIPQNADNMMPGSVVAKNPFVVNTSNNGSKEYAAIKVQFQKWEVESAAATDGKYVNMTASEVATFLKCYGILQSAGDNASTAGLTIGSGWTQILDKSYYDNSTDGTAGTANSDGAMYFYYGTAIEAETSTDVGSEGTATNADTWNIPGEKRTTPLFTHIRFVDGVSQSDINDLNSVLAGSAKPADPGWRIVVSGAAVQATDDSSVTAAKFVTDTSANWKTLLDANSTTDGTSATSKPTTATGVRAGKSTLTIPEASNVKKDGTSA